MKYVWMVVALVVAACGPSAAELKTAKTATYRGNASEMFKIVLDATSATYKIADAQNHQEASDDPADYELMTEPQWYSPEGGRESSGAGDFVNLVEGSIQLSLIVQLTPAQGGGFVVTVTPKTFQHVSGSPKPRELAPDDPNLPGFVQGRVDELHLEIHKRLQKYAAQ